MLPKLKNAIIFVSIALVLILGYVFFLRPKGEDPNLVATTAGVVEPAPSQGQESSPDQEFLPLLLNVKNIKLDDSVFSDPAFMTLVDGSILLVPDGNEGRVNPFAPLGVSQTTTGTAPKPQ